MTAARNIVLLTATVQPKPGQAALSVTDADARLRQYRDALAFYGGLVDDGVLDGVVFFDNSGVGVNAIGAQFQRRRVRGAQRVRPRLPGRLPPRLWRVQADRPGLRSVAAAARRRRGNAGVEDHRPLPGAQPAADDPRRAGRRRFLCRHPPGLGRDERHGLGPARHAQIVRGLCEHFKTDMAPELILAQLALGDGSLRTVTRWRWPPFIRGTRGANGLPYGGRAPRLRHALKVLGHLLRGRAASGAAP